MSRTAKLINESMKLDESTLKIFTVLLEKFGEPIGKQPSTVGARDEGPGGKALWDDEPKMDHEWSDPNVVDENSNFFGARHGIPKQYVNPKYHHEGFIDNLDEYKAQFVLTPETQRLASQVVGPTWVDMKPSAILKALRLVSESIEQNLTCNQCGMMTATLEGEGGACECSQTMPEDIDA